MKFLRYTALLLFILPIILSQKPAIKPAGDFVTGEIIMMLKADEKRTQAEVLRRVLDDFKAAEMTADRQLSQRMNIWTVKYDPAKASDHALLRSVKDHPMVVEAQFNHYIELRESIPSDQYFDQQWNMHNTGQTGGLEDADIDGPEAWDYATGGTTVTGDTIIIAIVDDGFDIDHDDIRYWKNWREIPGNGIDDDTNGYVDDYDGWNSWSVSGNIIERDHGTHVSGIAAARGNNDMGVTGVNWNTKVMPVVGSATVESIVVAAYSYIYEMRKKYNETDGEEGAFIVATNNSFGVNMGQPEDYPIWEAMYDSMGMVGILSAGATANANWDIDEVGDVPTAMESDYLISVTNTTHTDEKSPGAAYGLTTIDLGAPGTSIYSTRQSNGYGYKSGTSMATPHVAGAVALLWSAVDSSFMAESYEDPGAASLKIKQFILDGADPVETLEGKTVTGGRLNVFNSIKLMSLYLDPGDLYIDGFQNQIYTEEIIIYNNIAEEVTYSTSVQDPGLWLDVAPVSGNVPGQSSDTIYATVNTDGLAVGEYDNQVIVTSNEEDLIVNISLNVMESLASSPESLILEVEAGETDVFDFTLSNLLPDAIDAELSFKNLTTWLSLNPENVTVAGESSETISLTAESLGIPPDTYLNTIVVDYDDSGQIEIPVEISVVLPAITISVDSLNSILGPNESESTDFTLKNNTEDPLPFILDMEIAELWMSYTPDEGTIIPGATMAIDFEFNSQLLLEGIYQNNLIIKFGEEEEKTVPVRLDVIFFNVDEITALEQFLAAPNPVSSELNVLFELSEPAYLNISLFDAAGQLVEKLGDGTYPSGQNRLVYNPSVKSGTYFLKITDGKGVAGEKIIIAR